MTSSNAEQTGKEHVSGGRTLFGHPIGLANLFGVELWERFSFYGMLTILGYYLYYSLEQGGLGLPQETATGIVGAYGGLVYLSTVLGGWLADRIAGMERMVFYGGVVVMFGHISLAVLPGLTGVGVGLVLIALGSGALKANASSLLGTLYEKGDPRADGGFTLFYLGINLGAFVGPLITGLLQTELGFHYGFAAAAVGMAFGLTQYVIFRRNLGDAGKRPPNPWFRDRHLPVPQVDRADDLPQASGGRRDQPRRRPAAARRARGPCRRGPDGIRGRPPRALSADAGHASRITGPAIHPGRVADLEGRVDARRRARAADRRADDEGLTRRSPSHRCGRARFR